MAFYNVIIPKVGFETEVREILAMNLDLEPAVATAEQAKEAALNIFRDSNRDYTPVMNSVEVYEVESENNEIIAWDVEADGEDLNMIRFY